MKVSSVDSVVKNSVCCGCGTCAGVCPYRAITMCYSGRQRVYVPRITETACADCGVCSRVCPGVNMLVPNSRTDGDHGKKYLHGYGEYLKSYVGHACDPQIRYGAASGGVATALSVFLLKARLVDAVVGTEMVPESPLDTRPVLCTSKGDVLRAMGSKYCPASTNAILKDIDATRLQTIAFVGLPCHVQGIQAAKDYPPLNKAKSVYTIGLLCGGVRGQEGTKWILRKRKINIQDVHEIKYRGEGWPAGMRVSFKNKEEVLKIPLWEYYDQYFASWRPWRCSLCLDRTAVLADISLGDAWLSELRHDSEGSSLIIARTESGLQLISQAAAAGVIRIAEIDMATLQRSQTLLVKHIDHTVREANFLARLLGWSTPTYGSTIDNPGWRSLLRRTALIVKSTLLRQTTRSVLLFTLVQHLSWLIMSPWRCLRRLAGSRIGKR